MNSSLQVPTPFSYQIHSPVLNNQNHSQFMPLKQRKVSIKNINNKLLTPVTDIATSSAGSFTIKNENSTRKSTGDMRAALRIKNKFSYLNQSLSTPKKQKVMSFKADAALITANKMVKSLREVETIESKCDDSMHTALIEESEVVFKGSRDVKDIVPMKLIYDQIAPDYKVVRKSSSNVMLVRELSTLYLFGIIKLRKNEFLLQCEHPQILQAYHQKELSNQQKLIYVQPYQYTLQQLINMGSLTFESCPLMLNKLKGVLQYLFEKGHKQLTNNTNMFLNHIYYIHGKFKVLPVCLEPDTITFNQFFQKLEIQMQLKINLQQ